MSTACIIALTLSAAVIIALAAANIVRSREIRLISRQLQFIRDNTSNMEITASTPFREINELSQSVNEVLEKYKKIELHSERREREFKSTITNLSHDIRTPLTSLDGYFQLLSQASSDEEKSHYSEIIGERINSLKNILEELFTYTKLQDNQFELELETVNITQTVFNSVFAFYDDFSSKGIEPKINISEEKLFINGNEEALKRVFYNIIKNAKEHIGSSGENCSVSVDLSENSGIAVFKCSNSVEYSEDMEIDKVFERFYKSDKARTANSTGLGLSIARELVTRMGGTITAKLERGEFSVRVEFEIKK